MTRQRVYLLTPALLLSLMVGILAIMPTLAQASGGSFIGQFHTIRTLVSTVPTNGDVNPYGTVVVPRSVGKLVQGDVLVSNFNNKANLQGTGTTIVQISPKGVRTLFAQINANRLPGSCPGGVGLTTALSVLKRGWVIVGSLPTSNGMAATAKAGCLLVLDSRGTVVKTFSGSPLNGPWDMTALDNGSDASLFVTNVLNGTVAANGKVVNQGTVVRIKLNVPMQGSGKPSVASMTIIGSGFPERTDPAALVIGPTGVGLRGSTLYVADSLTVNGNDGNIVETTPGGTQIAHKLLDNTGSPPGSGCLFGLAIVPGGDGVYFVDDCDNTLKLLS